MTIKGILPMGKGAPTFPPTTGLPLIWIHRGMLVVRASSSAHSSMVTFWLLGTNLSLGPSSIGGPRSGSTSVAGTAFTPGGRFSTVSATWPLNPSSCSVTNVNFFAFPGMRLTRCSSSLETRVPPTRFLASST